ncbi:hypothetical protein BBJ28_00009238 [Nothophytophthora sp. Chile5]|nr:hypothetical protein BBJ28_00009238 [Nothophytophthora sp. Chile5]
MEWRMSTNALTESVEFEVVQRLDKPGANANTPHMSLIFAVGGLFMHAIIPIMTETSLQVQPTVLTALSHSTLRLPCQGTITATWKVEADVYDADEDEDAADDASEEEQDDEDLEGGETELLPRVRPNAATSGGSVRLQLPRVHLVDPQSVHVARQRGRGPNAGDGLSYSWHAYLIATAQLEDPVAVAEYPASTEPTNAE